MLQSQIENKILIINHLCKYTMPTEDFIVVQTILIRINV